MKLSEFSMMIASYHILSQNANNKWLMPEKNHPLLVGILLGKQSSLHVCAARVV